MEERFAMFTILTSNLSRSIKRIKAEEMAEFDLKSTHVSCLYYLYKKESLTAKQLCDICKEDKASISRSIDELENKGYITCDSTLKKRYKSLLFLTKEGKKVSKQIAIRIDEILEIASVGLEEDERVIMYNALSKINDNLINYLKKGE